MNEKMIINLTPHEVTLVRGTEKLILPACETPARVEEKLEKAGNIAGYDIFRKKFGKTTNLPDENLDTIYIVSRIVAEANTERTDIFVPEGTFRDETGRIIGARALATLAPGYIK